MRNIFVIFCAIACCVVFLGNSAKAEPDAKQTLGQHVQRIAGENEDKTSDISEASLLTAKEILDAFKNAGLPVGESVIYDAGSDPNNRLGRPGQYTGKAAWADTRIKQSDSAEGLVGGTVEVFSSHEDLAARRDYIKSVTDGLPMLQQYMFEAGNSLLRLEFALTPDQAAEYERVMRSLLR